MLVAFSSQDQQKLQDRRGLNARGLRRADRIALFRHHRDPTVCRRGRKLKNVDAHQSGGRLQPSDAGPADSAARSTARSSPSIANSRFASAVVAPGAAGHAGADRSLQERHVRRDPAGAQYRDRRPGRSLDVRRRLEGALRADQGADPASSRGRSAPLRCALR